LDAVWNAADVLGYPFGPFFRLLILTAQRRGEVAAMRWSDVDMERALWTLPAEQTKPGRVHDVPLSGPALGLLQRLPRFEGPYVFTTTSGAKPINGFTKAKNALDRKILSTDRTACRTGPFTT
jgi:integrase